MRVPKAQVGVLEIASLHADEIMQEVELGHRFLPDSNDHKLAAHLMSIDLRTTELWGGGVR